MNVDTSWGHHTIFGMPPKARRQRASVQRPGPVPGPTLPPPAPAPPAAQQHPFYAPLPPFQPLYAAAQPTPVGGGQYHAAGLPVGMNAPHIYGQPYGAPLAPYPPYPPPHFPPYPGVASAQLQPWSYGHFPTGPLPNPVPHPSVTQPDNAERAPPMHGAQVDTVVAPDVGVVERDARREGTGMGDGMESTEVQPKRIYPNKQVSDGGTSFSVRENAYR